MLAFFVPVEQSSVFSKMIPMIYFEIGWFGLTGVLDILLFFLEQ